MTRRGWLESSWRLPFLLGSGSLRKCAARTVYGRPGDPIHSQVNDEESKTLVAELVGF